MASDRENTGEPGDGAAAGDADTLRTGFCAILGLPNVGKSTLLNRVLGVRLAAVSRKPQTTRNRIVGVHNVTLPQGEAEGQADGEAAQIIFVDTPGIQKGPGALRQYMRDQALGAAGDSDVTLLLLDVADPRQRDPDALVQGEARALLDAVGEAPCVLALNKIDRLPGMEALLPVIAAYDAALPGRFAEIVPISATRGDNLGALVRAVASRLPRGPRMYPEDMVTDRAERFLAAELIREQLFRQLGQELPYSSAVVVESFRERPDRGDVVIDGVIYVERESQKGMVVGKGGARIKQVGTSARMAIAQLFGCPAHVTLRVKVAERWSQRPGGIRRMGYE